MLKNHERYRREIGNQNNNITDIKLKEINQYLQKEHLRIYGVPMNYVYRGGPLPEKFVEGLLNSQKSNKEMSIIEALFLIMEINQSSINYIQNISRIGTEGYAKSDDNKNKSQNNFRQTPNNNDSNSKLGSLISNNLNTTRNANNTIPSYKLNTSENSRMFRLLEDSRPRLPLRKLLQMEDITEPDERRVEAHSTFPDQENTITTNSESAENDKERQVDDYIEKLDMEADQKFRNLENKNFDSIATQSDREMISNSNRGANQIFYKAILAVHDKDTNSATPFFTVNRSEIAYAFFDLNTNQIGIGAFFDNETPNHRQSTMWHEHLHAAMKHVPNNSFLQTERSNPIYKSTYDKVSLKYINNKAYIKTDNPKEIFKGDLDLVFKIDDGDIDKVEEVNNFCLQFAKTLEAGKDFFAKDNATVSEDMLKVANIIEKFPSYDYIISYLQEKEAVTKNRILGMFFEIEYGALYNYYESLRGTFPAPTTINGECLATTMDDFLSSYLNSEDETAYVINTIIKEFNPEFYKTNPKTGEFFIQEVEKYRRKFLKKAVAETNVYDDFFTLKEKFHATVDINNEMHQRHISAMTSEILELITPEDKNNLNLLLSKYGKTDNLFSQVEYKDMAISSHDAMSNIHYDYSTGSIKFTPDFATSFIPLSQLYSSNDSANKRYELRKKRYANYFSSLLMNARNQRVAHYYSTEDEIKFVNDPDTAMRYANEYKSFLVDLKTKLQSELESSEKSSGFGNFFKGDVLELYGNDPKNLINELDTEIKAINHLIEHAEMGLFINSINEKSFLKKASEYLKQTTPPAYLEDRKPASLEPEVFIYRLFNYINQENDEMKKKFEGSDIESRKKIFNAFNGNVYTREAIIKVINSLFEGQYSRFLNYIELNPGRILFDNPYEDSFEDKKFIDVNGGKEAYDKSKNELKQRAIRYKTKIAHENYLRRVLENSFSEKFSEAAQNNIIEGLLKDPKMDDLIEPINLATLIGYISKSPNHFFKNPDLIFIYNNKVIFNLSNLKGELIDYLKECQKSYESYRKNGYFENLDTAEKCTDGTGEYLVQGKEEENVFNPFSGHKESTILALNPAHVVKPPEIDRSSQINCANLIYKKSVVAPFGLENTLPSLQNCFENKIQSSILSNGFNITVYQNNATFKKTVKECSLKDGNLSCTP